MFRGSVKAAKLRLSKKGDRGDAGGACLEARRSVLGGDSTEGKYGETDGVAGLAQTIEAHNRAGIVLGKRGEDGSIEGEVGGFLFSAEQFRDCVAGDANEKSLREDATERRRGNGIAREVDALCATGDGDIRAIIDEDAGGGISGETHDAADKGGELAGGKVFFADLDVVDAGGDGALDRGEGIGAAGSDLTADHRAW